MLVKVRITTVLLLMALPVAFLQGCGSSSSNGDSAGGGQSLNLSLTTTNGGTTLIADGNSSSQIQMTVTNQNGQPIGNRPVQFSTNAGVLFPVPGTNVISTNAAPRAATRQTVGSSSITVNTNTQGIALVQITSSTNVETATVTAEVEGFRQAFNINFISGIPDKLTVSVSPGVVGIGQTATVLATVVDSTDQPVVGVSVTFSLSVSNSGASISPATRVTDTNGQARVTYTAGAITGEDTIQAQLGTVTSATTTTAINPDTTSVSVSADSIAATDVKLLVSSPQMNSDGSETVTLTALVRDFNNNLLSGVDVTFGTDSSSAAIQVTRGTTDTTGTAEALLTTGGDFSNRVIELVAQAGSLTGSNSVVVSGTTIAISGTTSIVAGETTTLSLLLQDSAGTGIANQDIMVSSNDNPSKKILSDPEWEPPESEPESEPPLLTFVPVTTDSNGNATVDLTAMGADTDTIKAEALGAEALFTLNVSSEQFALMMVLPDKVEIELFDNDNVTETNVGEVNLTWDWGPTPPSPPTRPVNFFISRGTLHVEHPNSPPASPDDEGASVSVLTGPPTPDGTRVATVFATSESAGSATIRAAAADDPNGPSSEIAIEFVATKAHSLVLQASPSTLGINPGGATDQQSIITAIVRDPNNNLVKNKTVSFNLIDVSGGSISPPSATTDSFGRASTVYTAGPTPSAQDGVIIDAEVTTDTGDTPCGRDIDAVPISGPCNQVQLTVAQQSLSITLGNGNDIVEPNTTVFHMPFVVLVTDANSNPVPNTTVEINLIPLRYRTGTLEPIFDIDGNFEEWDSEAGVIATCPNEDLLTGDPSKDRNGILDDDGMCSSEDANCNGILDPGNVAGVPGAVTTDTNGFAEFNVEYPQNHNHWVEVELEARTTVAGSESSATMSFFLVGLASDFESEPPPPGVTSPFGTGACN